MKKLAQFLVLLFIATTLLSSVKSYSQDLENSASESELLVQYLEANGNFINSDLAPAIILPSEINDNVKNKKYLVLDIRSESWYAYGHIKNAVNVNGPELLDYFQTKIDPASFDKITIVCYSGQSAAYYTGLLRLYGYNNVYNLKWGMSSWADEFAENIWVKNTKESLVDQLETTSNPMPEKNVLPTITTGKTDAQEILKERITEAFAKPYKEFIVTATDAFENPDNYFIVSYLTEEQYNYGHPKGAVRYEPGSLSSTANLLTLPTDKKILVNCTTGQAAAYVVGYLQILGYDVANLAYGSNSYMNSVLNEKNWNGFNKNEIKNYQVVE